jgi:hypothetical protein
MIKCAVKSCKNRALILYGDKWICGECFVKLLKKQVEEKNKQIEELEKELEK